MHPPLLPLYQLPPFQLVLHARDAQLIKRADNKLALPVLRRQRAVALPNHDARLHARLLGSADLVDVVAQEQPLSNVLLPRARDLPIARAVGLGPRVHGVKVSGEKRAQVAVGGVLEEQLLCGHGAGGVDDDGEGGAVEGAQYGRDVGKERAFQGAVEVALGPEVALEGFEVGDFEILRHEGLDVGEEGGGAGAVLSGEGGEVGLQGGRVPFGG